MCRILFSEPSSDAPFPPPFATGACGFAFPFAPFFTIGAGANFLFGKLSANYLPTFEQFLANILANCLAIFSQFFIQILEYPKNQILKFGQNLVVLDIFI